MSGTGQTSISDGAIVNGASDTYPGWEFGRISMRPREPGQVNPIDLYRPVCPKCGFLTLLARVEPAPEADHDLRTFECDHCGRAEIVKIKFK